MLFACLAIKALMRSWAAFLRANADTRLRRRTGDDFTLFVLEPRYCARCRDGEGRVGETVCGGLRGGDRPSLGP